MTKEAITKIRAWLAGTRDYRQGVALYDSYGHNRMLKRRFMLDHSELTERMLADELRKLAGMTVAEFNGISRRAAVAAETEACDTDGTARDDNAADSGGDKCRDASDVVAKVQRFRDKYRFLAEPDCPDVLKVLANDLLTCYDTYCEAHRRMLQLDDENTRAAAAEAEIIVESYLQNRQIREELDYYLEHRVLLGHCEKVAALMKSGEFKAMSDIDLQRELSNARSNVSKWRRRLDAAEQSGQGLKEATEAAEQWLARKNALENELNLRKKK